MNATKLKLVSVSAAVTYRFEPEGREFGWALCTVNDATGELSIQSDWGNWSHRWNVTPSHLGAPTFTDFIADRSSAHYLAGKLSREQGPRNGSEFDVHETIAKFRTMLASERLAQGRDNVIADKLDHLSKGRRWLTPSLARDIWDALGSLDECGRSADLFCERFYNIEGYEFVTEEPWEYTVYTPTVAYQVLLGSILPALIEACIARVQSMAQQPEAEVARG